MLNKVKYIALVALVSQLSACAYRFTGDRTNIYRAPCYIKLQYFTNATDGGGAKGSVVNSGKILQ